jgi:hypothetical protein
MSSFASSSAKLKTKSPISLRGKSELRNNYPTKGDYEGEERTRCESPISKYDHSEEPTQMRQQVSDQQMLIRKLQVQLEPVLSYLGIADILDTPIVEPTSPSPADDLKTDSHCGHGNNTDNTEDRQNNSETFWSEVVQRRIVAGSMHHCVNHFCDP